MKNGKVLYITAMILIFLSAIEGLYFMFQGNFSDYLPLSIVGFFAGLNCISYYKQKNFKRAKMALLFSLIASIIANVSLGLEYYSVI